MSILSPNVTLSSLTKILFVLTVVIGLATIIALGGVHLNAEKIDYSVESMNQACEPPSDNNTEAGSNDTQLPDHREHPDRVLEYSELSPEAQEVFRSALQTRGEYTTRTHPDEFELEDFNRRNRIQYESECYELTAESRSSFGTAFVALGLLVVGGGITVIFALASLASYVRDLGQLRTESSTE